MNVLVVDTSSWISFFKGHDNHELELALEEGRVFLPPLVAAELVSGKMKSKQRGQLIEMLRELPLCNSDLDHWVRVGQLRLALIKKGITVSTPDAHIAQCAIDLNGYLMSEDNIFKKISAVISLKRSLM